MKTYAHTHTPRKTYGQQKARGDRGEKKAAASLRNQGYSVLMMGETQERNHTSEHGFDLRTREFPSLSFSALLTVI